VKYSPICGHGDDGGGDFIDDISRPLEKAGVGSEFNFETNLVGELVADPKNSCDSETASKTDSKKSESASDSEVEAEVIEVEVEIVPETDSETNSDSDSDSDSETLEFAVADSIASLMCLGVDDGKTLDFKSR